MTRLRWAAMLGLATVPSLTSCVGMTPIVSEPLRVQNVNDLSPEALGLERGITTFAAARERLAQLQLTGIVSDQYARETGAVIEVLSADYQRHVHVFRGGVYDHSILLQTAGVPPYGLALKLARHASHDVLLVLYRDPLDRAASSRRALQAASSPTLLTFGTAGASGNERSHYFAHVATTSLASIAKERGGLTHPLLVGSDLDGGVLLVARDKEGALWDRTYLILLEQNRLHIEAKPMSVALQCSCVHDYVYGGEVSAK